MGAMVSLMNRQYIPNIGTRFQLLGIRNRRAFFRTDIIATITEHHARTIIETARSSNFRLCPHMRASDPEVCIAFNRSALGRLQRDEHRLSRLQKCRQPHCWMYFQFVRYNIPRLQQKVVMLITNRYFHLGHRGGDLLATDPAWLTSSVPKDRKKLCRRDGKRFGEGEFAVPDSELQRP